MNNEILNKNHIVEKSKALIWAKFSEYNLAESRLVDTYLAKINARNEDSSEVTFSVDEYLRLLGYKYPDKVSSKEIEKTLDRFLKASIRVDLNNKGDYRKVNLFSDAMVIVSNPDFAKRTITIDCNPKLKEAFFGIADKGYVEYALDYSLRLRSKYAIKLYPILKDKLYKKEWQVELKELRELIGAVNKNNESFREFNKVLQKCQDDINSMTDIEFEYEKISKGRLTRGILFKIKKKERSGKKKEIIDSDQLPGQMDIYDYPEAVPEEKPLSAHEMFCKKINDEAFKSEFTLEQVEYLINIGSMAANAHASYGDLNKANDEKIQYYREKYLQMNAGCDSKEQKARVKYLSKILMAERLDLEGFEPAEEQHKWRPKKNAFNNFKQRNYDFAELEKLLLKAR